MTIINTLRNIDTIKMMTKKIDKTKFQSIRTNTLIHDITFEDSQLQNKIKQTPKIPKNTLDLGGFTT